MGSDGYLHSTRHPWACLAFVAPFLVAYEGGLWALGQGSPDMPRNGADFWLRESLAQLGLAGLLWAPFLLLGGLLAWSFLHRADRPDDLPGLWIGMALESILFAFGLWALSRAFFPFLDSLGLEVPASSDPPLEHLLGYLGAGIYEEALFRLVLFSALTRFFSLAEVPPRSGFALAALVSSLAFALAHNLGTHGEVFDSSVFLFRTLAGLYFALLFHLRGFGVAVGAHAGYDLLVGVLIH